MNCILSLAQAYEVFFSLFFRVELFYKPLAADLKREVVGSRVRLSLIGSPVEHLNRLLEKLHDKIKKHAIRCMRALFLEHMVTGRPPKNLAEAVDVVAALPDC